MNSILKEIVKFNNSFISFSNNNNNIDNNNDKDNKVTKSITVAKFDFIITI